MNEIISLAVMVLHGFAKLSGINALLAIFLGFIYSVLATVLEREFLGMGPTQIMLVGIAGCIVSFALSVGFTVAGNYLVPATHEDGGGA